MLLRADQFCSTLVLLWALPWVGPQVGIAPTTAEAAEIPPEQVEFFEKKIRPVLVEHCYACHSAEAAEIEGGLLLDNAAAMRKGGDSGPLFVPGEPATSRLLTAMRYDDETLQMPPDEKLPDQVLADFRQWVEWGAPDPRTGAALAPADVIAARAANHWAFRPPQTAERPPVRQQTWPVTDIDYLVLARMEAAGLTPAPQADRYVLGRRLYFDLTGLPPTMAQVSAFLADDRAEAYTRLVDQLLDSQQFGERWARHWLDVARFADTKGYVFTADRNYPHAYKYRDWVISAINQDMPYDQFLKWQLAADKLSSEGDRSQLAAMGFLTLGRRFINNQHDIIDDRIDVVFRGTMGLTVGCARCHDHKYDPLSMSDYYAMYGVFQSSREQQDDDLPLRLVDKDRPANARIFLRGNPANRGDPVPRRYLSFFAGKQAEPFQQGSGRLELAEAIVDPRNPLTARVLVNRVWGHLFGRGLVRTASDFGMRSEPPVQQDVLDHLAATFMRDGWSLKRLIRGIVLSSVYRQQSTASDAAMQADPDNELLSHTRRRRLDFEAMRDAWLAVSGQLDGAVGGESARIAGETPSRRRTLYAFIDRQNLPGVFRTFDFASPDTHTPQRLQTTVPQQALFLMNNRFSLDAAVALAQQVPGDGDPHRRIKDFYAAIFARAPSEEELALGRQFVAARSSESVDHGPWQFGYGHIEGAERAAVVFHRLPHFTGDTWQGGPERPDPKLGWALVTAAGGHPGNDQDHAAIRRWVAPRAGIITVAGKLKHPSDQGDGVRGRVISSRQGAVGEWTAANRSVDTSVASLNVQPGDCVDFVVDCRTGPNHDSFQWQVTIAAMAPPGADGEAAPEMWRSEAGFRGPAPPGLTAWARYAQTLMMTNEFIMLD